MNRRTWRWIARALWALYATAFFPAAALGADHTVELQEGWRMSSALKATEDGKTISQQAYDAKGWHAIAKMPATVLQVLENDGTYPNLYFGTNLTNTVPHDLYQQDWWYRTSFTVPAGQPVQWLIFKGINYRAEIWVNGQRIADNHEVVGMYGQFEFNVTGKVKPGPGNTLAVRVTPEQKLQGINGVELADSWYDWINWAYIGLSQGRTNISFVPDRNAGVWKQVYLRSTGAVEIEHPYVATDLPLPQTTPAALTVYCDVKNALDAPARGTLHGEITRAGKPNIRFERDVTLAAHEQKEIAFSPQAFAQLTVADPDLWWPYQWGTPALYHLQLTFTTDNAESDAASLDFGIRKVTQHRDTAHTSRIAPGGDFYLQVNGVNFLARGADYTPDLLYKYDEGREEAVVRYVKDMGLNFLRWESKISSEHIFEVADREGVPVMLGWMCCNQWERWSQWDAEDQRVARESLRAQTTMLRAHPSVFLWANASDGYAPDAVRNDYNKILRDLHWQNAVVDTVSAGNRTGGTLHWDGVHMEGPYSWRPPTYWFDSRYKATAGACAEQGDNESIPPLESLKKFIPADKLWPINEAWYYHAGSFYGNPKLQTIQKALDKRYGPSSGVAEFAQKAQLAHYENTRAQFEAYGALGFDTHKMTLYWMLDSHWPSFFGHIIDYYLKPGGAYFGAKKALRPVGIVFDYYTNGDRTKANIYATNTTMSALKGLRATVSLIALDGTEKYTHAATDITVAANSTTTAMQIPRMTELAPAYFVRCQLYDAAGELLAENVYWQSSTDDDVGPARNDSAFDLKPVSWADFTSLQKMDHAAVTMSGTLRQVADQTEVAVTLTNHSKVPAFFLRAEAINGPDGDEILPILWDDNYVTVFSGETVTLHAHYRTADGPKGRPHLRVEGYNVPAIRQDIGQ